MCECRPPWGEDGDPDEALMFHDNSERYHFGEAAG